MKKRLAVLISGGGSNLQVILDHIKAGKINGEIVLVLSNQANAFGLVRAKNAGITTAVLQHTDYQSRLDFDQAVLKSIDAQQVDLVILAGFMRILTPEFVSHYTGRMLNIHPSLLPRYKGLDTHQRAINAGDSEHGCSVHFVTPELDGGPVALQATVPIDAADDAQSLQQKVHNQEHLIYPEVVSWFCADRLLWRDNNLYLDGELLNENGFKATLNKPN